MTPLIASPVMFLAICLLVIGIAAGLTAALEAWIARRERAALRINRKPWISPRHNSR